MKKYIFLILALFALTAYGQTYRPAHNITAGSVSASTITLPTTGTISIGEHTISRYASTYLQLSGGLLVGGSGSYGLTNTGGIAALLVNNFGNFNFRNKADAAWLPFATRNTAGSEAVYDLTNVGNITMPFASTIAATTGSLYISTVDGSDIVLKTNGTNRWTISGYNGIVPVISNTYDIGTSSLKVKDGYFAGTVYTDKLKHSDSDTTGVGSTANIGTIKYYNGHFYGLKAGTPPTWSQLDN